MFFYFFQGFTEMLARLWDYFCLGSSPDEPNLEEILWITPEDVNVEHLFDSLHPSKETIKKSCVDFVYFSTGNIRLHMYITRAMSHIAAYYPSPPLRSLHRKFSSFPPSTERCEDPDRWFGLRVVLMLGAQVG